MMKLKKNIIDKTNSQALKVVKPEPSPEEKRQAKIDYYRNWFRLDFPIFDEDEVEAAGGIDEVSYFEHGSFFDLNDEDVNYYQKKFAGLNALDVFYDLCLDHCQDTLEVLQKRMAKYPLLTDLYAKEFAESRNHKNQAPNEEQKKHHMHKLLKEQMEKVERNERAQARIKAHMVLIKKRLAELNKTNIASEANVVVDTNQTAMASQNTMTQNPNNVQVGETDLAQSENKKSKISLVTAVAMVPEMSR